MRLQIRDSKFKVRLLVIEPPFEVVVVIGEFMQGLACLFHDLQDFLFGFTNILRCPPHTTSTCIIPGSHAAPEYGVTMEAKQGTEACSASVMNNSPAPTHSAQGGGERFLSASHRDAVGMKRRSSRSSFVLDAKERKMTLGPGS